MTVTIALKKSPFNRFDKLNFEEKREFNLKSMIQSFVKFDKLNIYGLGKFANFKKYLASILDQAIQQSFLYKTLKILLVENIIARKTLSVLMQS